MSKITGSDNRGRWIRTPEQRAAKAEEMKALQGTRKGVKRTNPETRERLRKSIELYGITDIEDIIKRGPWQLVRVETKDGEQVMELHTEQSRLWQYAMNYAADRGGLPRAEMVQLSGAESLGPIEVRFTGFERPADS